MVKKEGRGVIIFGRVQGTAPELTPSCVMGIPVVNKETTGRMGYENDILPSLKWRKTKAWIANT